jgi:hypothetical protein
MLSPRKTTVSPSRSAKSALPWPGATAARTRNAIGVCDRDMGLSLLGMTPDRPSGPGDGRLTEGPTGPTIRALKIVAPGSEARMARAIEAALRGQS